MFISGGFALSMLGGAAANAAYSSDNANLLDRPRCDNGRTTFKEYCDDVKTVRNAQGATAVSSLLQYVHMQY